MAKDLYENYAEIRELYGIANEILGFDLAGICFNGPEEDLRQTKVTQPAIFVHSVALCEFVKKKAVSPNMVAGHSLGEYSALYSTGVVNFADGLRLVKLRAELMQKAGEINKGAMAAIIGLDADTLHAICSEASKAGIVKVANFNSPIQLVISGSVAGVEKAMEIAREKGAKKVVPLVVGGAFHSPLMDYAVNGFKAGLSETAFRKTVAPIYSNVTARPVTEPNELRELLLQQLTSPVRWVELVNKMINDGAANFFEIGPGTVLTGLVKRINKAVSCQAINSLESLSLI